MPSRYLSNEQLEEAVTSFLKQYHPSLSVPIPVEEILTEQLGFHIVPVPGLMRDLAIDGWLSFHEKEMFIDHDMYMQDSTYMRARFTIAHELGHIHLHNKILNHPQFKDVNAWKKFRLESKDYAPYETQANMFAGKLLMPINEIIQDFDKEKKSALKKQPKLSGLNNADFAPFISRPIARKYNVSEEAAVYRLSNLINAGKL